MVKKISSRLVSEYKLEDGAKAVILFQKQSYYKPQERRERHYVLKIKDKKGISGLWGKYDSFEDAFKQVETFIENI